MWEQAAQTVSSIFFHDKIEIFEDELTSNEIGEELTTPRSIGTFLCNIENNSSSTRQSQSGVSTPQTLRISLAKDVPISYNKTYTLKILKARISFSNEVWKVDGWVEGQISTVITVSREVAV